MIKEVTDIRDEWCDNDQLSYQSIKDLAWHVENDPLPDEPISLIIDARLMKLVPLIAKHLDHEDNFIRQLTVGGIVGRIGLAEYAEKALEMATTDSDAGVRDLATSSLGIVINKANPVLRKQIADHLYNVISGEEYDSLNKRAAFDSILKAADVPVMERIHTPYNPNHKLVQDFKEKYMV